MGGGEFAETVGVPGGGVKQRLSSARGRLQQELGEGEPVSLMEPLAPMRQWAWLPLDQMHALETRLTLGSDAQKEGSTMERREFLRHAAVGAAGLMLTEPENEVVPTRLTQKLTVSFKPTPPPHP